LLDAGIRQAEEISDLPNIKETIASRLPAVFGLDTWLAVQSPHDGEGKFKIGAAGELFVSLPTYDCLIQLTESRYMNASKICLYQNLISITGKAEFAAELPFIRITKDFRTGPPKKPQT
jgi:hypothetical protein